MATFQAATKLTPAVMLSLLWLAAGCVTKPKATGNYYLFPPPPDEPRLQYLMSFGSEDDLGGQGAFTEFIVGEQRLTRPIWKPYGLAVKKDQVFVADTQGANICEVDLVKRRIRYLRPDGQAAMKTPISVAVDEKGTRFVTDTKRSEVLVYDKTGSFQGTFGKKENLRPCGIAWRADKLYVTDLSNHCVRVYNKDTRELVLTVPPDNKDEKSKLFSPTNVAVDEKGNIYISDTGGFAVKVYDQNGVHLRGFGEQGLEPGRFAMPKGIGVDRQGRVYVIDAATAVAQLFDADGRLLMFFGAPKSSGAAGMYLPAGLTVDYENVDLFQKYVAPGYKLDYLIFLTNQAGRNKVSVYGFLKKG